MSNPKESKPSERIREEKETFSLQVPCLRDVRREFDLMAERLDSLEVTTKAHCELMGHPSEAQPSRETSPTTPEIFYEHLKDNGFIKPDSHANDDYKNLRETMDKVSTKPESTVSCEHDRGRYWKIPKPISPEHSGFIPKLSEVCPYCPKPDAVREGVDLGVCACMTCEKQICLCPQRLSNGDWNHKHINSQPQVKDSGKLSKAIRKSVPDLMVSDYECWLMAEAAVAEVSIVIDAYMGGVRKDVNQNYLKEYLREKLL